MVAGLGGSGKSTVARAVAARALSQDHRAWWVPAADAVQVTQLLLGLAGQLGASSGQVDEALAGRLNPSDVLWQQLENSGGWLLVLDNADDPAALTAGGRPVSSGSGWLRATRAGLVLVTSRTGDVRRWGPVAQVVGLESLGEADGGQVLLDLAPCAGTRADAEGLSEQLGGLPLALHQAGSYLASPFAVEATFTQYRQALSARFGELLGRGDQDRAKVIVTWELSLDALQAQGAGQARLLLRVLSCFDRGVPVAGPRCIGTAHCLGEHITLGADLGLPRSETVCSASELLLMTAALSHQEPCPGLKRGARTLWIWATCAFFW